MVHALNVNIPFPTTLVDLEEACATARDSGMADDARVSGNFMTASLYISQPGVQLGKSSASQVETPDPDDPDRPI